MRVLVACMLSILAACGGNSRGAVAPAPARADDLDLVLADSTWIASVDVERGAQAAIFAPYRSELDRKLRATTAMLSSTCKLDLMGSLRRIVFGVRNSGTIGTLVAHGVPTDRIRDCLTGPGHTPVAVVSDGIYRVAVSDAEVEIRIVDRDTTWVRWAPQGTLAPPASSSGDPNQMRPLLARVDRSATAWVVIRPSAVELRDWPSSELPPPVAVTASIRVGDAVSVDADYHAASADDARAAADNLKSQIGVARVMFQLDLSMHTDGDVLRFHAAASRASIERVVGALGTISD